MRSTVPSSALRRLANWLLRRQMDEKNFVVPGGRYGGDVSDGTYGDPHRDTRPDYLRQDSEGWKRIVRLDK